MELAITAQAEVMYLLDTNIVSELRRPRPHAGLIAWLSGIAPDQLFISAVTLGELQAGVENVKQQDTGRAEIIEGWIDSVAASYNVLPMDGGAFRCWARLMHGKPADLDSGRDDRRHRSGLQPDGGDAAPARFRAARGEGLRSLPVS